MEEYLKMVVLAQKEDLDNVSKDTMIQNLCLCETIEKICSTKSSVQLEELVSLYHTVDYGIDSSSLKHVTIVFISFLLRNPTFEKMDKDTRRYIFQYCIEKGYSEHLSSDMTKALFAKSHWKSLQEERQAIIDSLSVVEFRSRLLTMGELQSCFTRWSLSSSSLQLQTKAKLLNATLLRQMNTTSKESLVSFTHHFSSLMHSDSSILDIAVASFVLTYIPTLSVKYLRSCDVDSPLKENSLRYYLWKQLETYILNLTWNEPSDRYCESSVLAPFVLVSNVYSLFFACHYSYSFMEAIAPLVVQTSICLLNTTHALNEYMVILWSSLLLCSSGKNQVQFTKKLLKIVEDGIHSLEGKKWFEKCFN